MLTSTRRGISHPNPLRGDAPDIPAHMQLLVDAIDVDVIYNQGTNAARIAAVHQASGGRFWWTTDTLTMWYDDGTTWRVVGPGATLDYAQITSNTAGITTTTEGTAVTVIPGNSVLYDGTKNEIKFFCPGYSVAGGATLVFLRDSTVIGQSVIAQAGTPNGNGFTASTFDTPSAGSHTYTVKAFASSTNTLIIQAGNGTTGNLVPAYLKVTRA